MSESYYRFTYQVEAIQELLTNRIWHNSGQCLSEVWMPLMRGIDAFAQGAVDFSGFKRLPAAFREALSQAPWDVDFRQSFLFQLKGRVCRQLIQWRQEREDHRAMNAAPADKQRILKRLLALRSFESAILGQTIVSISS